MGMRFVHTVDMDAYRRRDYENICTCAVAAGSFSDQCKHVLRVLLDFGFAWDSFLKPWNTVQAWELQVRQRSPICPPDMPNSSHQRHASTVSPHCPLSQADWAAVVATIGTGAHQGRPGPSGNGAAPDARAAGADDRPSGAKQELGERKRRGGWPSEGLHR